MSIILVHLLLRIGHPLLMRSLLGVCGNRHLILRYYLPGLHNSTKFLFDLGERLLQTSQAFVNALEEHALLHFNGMNRIVDLRLTVNSNILRADFLSFNFLFYLIPLFLFYLRLNILLRGYLECRSAIYKDFLSGLNFPWVG